PDALPIYASLFAPCLKFTTCDRPSLRLTEPTGVRCPRGEVESSGPGLWIVGFPMGRKTQRGGPMAGPPSLVTPPFSGFVADATGHHQEQGACSQKESRQTEQDVGVESGKRGSDQAG